MVKGRDKGLPSLLLSLKNLFINFCSEVGKSGVVGVRRPNKITFTDEAFS